MKLTVLGASGRIGRHVVEQAVSAGHEVTALVRRADRLGKLAPRVRVVEGSIGVHGAGPEEATVAIGPVAHRHAVYQS